MIGDWVKLRTDDGTFIKVEVFELLQESSWGFIDGDKELDEISYDDVEPIPLTVNILYKNGFDCDEDGFISYNEFAINFGRDPFEEGPNLLFIMVGNCHVELQYVHELQHALRLCGIEKEIEI